MDSHEYQLRRVRAAVTAIRTLVDSMPVVALKAPMPARAHYLGVLGMQRLKQLFDTLETDLNNLESEIDDLVDEGS